MINALSPADLSTVSPLPKPQPPLPLMPPSPADSPLSPPSADSFSPLPSPPSSPSSSATPGLPTPPVTPGLPTPPSSPSQPSSPAGGMTNAATLNGPPGAQGPLPNGKLPPVSVIGPDPSQGNAKWGWKTITALYAALAVAAFFLIRKLFWKK